MHRATAEAWARVRASVYSKQPSMILAPGRLLLAAVEYLAGVAATVPAAHPSVISDETPDDGQGVEEKEVR